MVGTTVHGLFLDITGFKRGRNCKFEFAFTAHACIADHTVFYTLKPFIAVGAVDIESFIFP